jgi:hypothetical protein
MGGETRTGRVSHLHKRRAIILPRAVARLFSCVQKCGASTGAHPFTSEGGDLGENRPFNEHKKTPPPRPPGGGAGECE